MTVPTITLHDQTTIPQLGFGVFQVPPDQTAKTVLNAFEVGYRHIDTAQMYENEAGVGEAIDESLARLGIDQVDLFLIHWPLPTRYDGDYVTTWRTMAEFVEDGRARSVGVSNFEPAHLDRIISETGVVPVLNQVEVHPFFGNEDVRAACARHDVAVEAWAPIARGKVNDDATITGIADRLGRTPAQVALRWHVQRGDIVFPKTVTPERMQENFDIFDFELSEDDMSTITALDRGEEGRGGPHPDTFDMIPD
jgi:2,5-diketo-D-gluconate reductase A